MEINKPPITVASFVAIALNGVAFTFMGVSLPSLQAQFGIGIEQAGTLMASFQTGLTIFTLLGGILSDRFCREWIITIGCILLGIGSFLLCIVPSFEFSLMVVWSMGAGIGFILSGSNTLLVSLYTSYKGTILNIHHVFFGVGAIVGPALMGILITRGNHWRSGYIGLGIILFLLCSVFAFSEKKIPVTSSDYSHDNNNIMNLLRDRKFLVILIVNFLTMGSQVVIMLFGAIFLVQSKQCSLAEAGGALSVFSIFIVLGRIVCSKLTLTINHARIVLVLVWSQTAMLFLMWKGDGLFVLVILAISGVTFSGTYPTLLALTSVLFPEREGTSLGLLSTMGGLGSIVMCWFTGYIAGLTNIGLGFIITFIACLVALVLFQMNYHTLCLKGSQ